MAERFPELSAREREVLEHLAEGLTNQQIGDLLFISPITVRNHVSSILAKLQGAGPAAGDAAGPRAVAGLSLLADVCTRPPRVLNMTLALVA